MSLAKLKKPLLLAVRAAVAKTNGAPADVTVSTANGGVTIRIGALGKPINKAEHYKVDKFGVSFSVLVTAIASGAHYTPEAFAVLEAARAAATGVMAEAGITRRPFVTFTNDADDEQVADLRAAWLVANVKPIDAPATVSA